MRSRLIGIAGSVPPLRRRSASGDRSGVAGRGSDRTRSRSPQDENGTDEEADEADDRDPPAAGSTIGIRSSRTAARRLRVDDLEERDPASDQAARSLRRRPERATLPPTDAVAPERGRIVDDQHPAHAEPVGSARVGRVHEPIVDVEQQGVGRPRGRPAPR